MGRANRKARGRPVEQTILSVPGKVCSLGKGNPASSWPGQALGPSFPALFAVPGWIEIFAFARRSAIPVGKASESKHDRGGWNGEYDDAAPESVDGAFALVSRRFAAHGALRPQRGAKDQPEHRCQQGSPRSIQQGICPIHIHLPRRLPAFPPARDFVSRTSPPLTATASRPATGSCRGRNTPS